MTPTVPRFVVHDDAVSDVVVAHRPGDGGQRVGGRGRELHEAFVIPATP